MKLVDYNKLFEKHFSSHGARLTSSSDLIEFTSLTGDDIIIYILIAIETKQWML